MPPPLLLYLDLGDVLTKGLAVGEKESRRFYYPSVVAHRLLDDKEAAASLLLDDEEALPRPTDFEPSNYPRGRSYPRGSTFLHEVRPVPRARFAGWPATACGADRQLLGHHPTADNIDALVHKAFMMSKAEGGDAELVFVVDEGVKAEAIQRHAEALPEATRFQEWTIGCPLPRTVELGLRGRVIDAAECIVEGLPPEVGFAQVRKLLVVDIGYVRIKLAILTSEGCEHQQQRDGIGVSDCVQRILRDGQEQGLVEDEFAVIKALEESSSVIEVAGRTFDVGRTLESAMRGLEEELANTAQRAIVEDYGRQGEMCQAVAIVGGGAAVVGEGVAERLEASDLGLAATWVATDTRFLLVEGARKLDERRA